MRVYLAVGSARRHAKADGTSAHRAWHSRALGRPLRRRGRILCREVRDPSRPSKLQLPGACASLERSCSGTLIVIIVVVTIAELLCKRCGDHGRDGGIRCRGGGCIRRVIDAPLVAEGCTVWRVSPTIELKAGEAAVRVQRCRESAACSGTATPVATRVYPAVGSAFWHSKVDGKKADVKPVLG